MKSKFAEYIENLLFYLVVFTAPINLGKHYIFEFSYIYSKLLDYVIPTVFVADIFVFLLLVWVLSKTLKKSKKLFTSWSSAFLLLFLFSVFLSVLGSFYFLPSAYIFGRTFLYACFGIYLFLCRDLKEDFSFLYKIFLFWLVFLSVLGILQWVFQGSVFNNYLFLGEQPYSFSSRGIVKESLFGFTRIPPYGLFRHPNTFGAFMSFLLIFTLFGWKNSKKNSSPFGRLFWVFWLLGMVVLLLTFSRFVLFGFLIGVFILVVPEKCVKPAVFSALLTGFTMLLGIVFLPWEVPSLLRRKNLIFIGWNIFKERPVFGLGPGNFLYFVDDYSVKFGFSRFTQPIHNIYLLLAVESGIFAIFFFLFMLSNLIKNLLTKAKNKYFPLLLALLIPFLFMSFFDHFLFTSHQLFLLFWLTVGFTLQYNST